MTQASTDPKKHTTPPPSLGAAAAAAVTGNKAPGAAPEDVADDDADDGDDDGADGSPAGKKNRNPRKIYVVIGELKEFETISKAEKFLNGPDAPLNYTVLRGLPIGTNKKVSLR